MNHRIRLGPMAIFLCVMTMIIATIAVLTISTSGADLVMARRFASVTQTRYALEADGEEFLAAAEAGADLSSMPGVSARKDGFVFEKKENGYKLEVEISRPGDGTDSFEVREFRVSRIWEADDPADDIWKGN